jgi:hypothetical protein
MNRETRTFHFGTILAFVCGDVFSGKGMYLSLGGCQEVEEFFRFMISYTVEKDCCFNPELKGLLEAEITASLLKQFPQIELVCGEVSAVVHSLRATLDPRQYRQIAFSTTSVKILFAEYGEQVEVTRLGEIDFNQLRSPSRVVESMLEEVGMGR